MISTALRPSRPSTSGGLPVVIASTKSASWRAWPWCEIAAGLLEPPEAPVFWAKRCLTAWSSGVSWVSGIVPTYNVAGVSQDLKFTPAALAGIFLGAVLVLILVSSALGDGMVARMGVSNHEGGLTAARQVYRTPSPSKGTP